MMNHLVSRLQVPFGWCSIDCVYCIESFVVLRNLSLNWKRNHRCSIYSWYHGLLWTKMTACWGSWAGGRDDLLPALDIRIYFTLSTIPDVNADRVLYKPVLMESGWSSKANPGLIWLSYIIGNLCLELQKEKLWKFYDLLKINCI